MRCPWCAHSEDRVIDSRSAEAGVSIRRRRECLHCHRRFTTYERAEETSLLVAKRDGGKEPFDGAKVASGVAKAIKNRPVTDDQVQQLAAKVEAKLRRKGPVVTTQEIGLEVLAQLRRLDDVAYMRFASVYKDFQEVTDFERELGLLLQKREAGRTPAKPRSGKTPA